ncbi:AMP-binding protein, partial [Kocuria oceani]
MSTEQQTTQAEDYAEVYRRSVRDPERFWLEAARAVDWTREPTVALDAAMAPLYRWFPDGELNTSYNALDRHVEAGHGERTALVYDSALLGVQKRYSYARLRDEVALFAGALAARGVGRGDRVLVYLPMIPQAAVAMLACARLGAVHSVVFGGFAPKELAARIDDSRPRVVVTTTGGLEPKRRIEYIPAIEEALRLARHEPGTVVVHERPGFETTVEQARERAG